MGAQSPASRIESIVDELLATDDGALPFDAEEQVDVTTLATQEGPYSTVTCFQIASANRKWRGYLKVADSELIAREFEALTSLSRLMNGEQFGIARPIAHLVERSALVTEAAPGVDLGTAIKEEVVGFGAPRQIDRVVRYCELSGSWLRAFHQATLVEGVDLSLDEMRSYVDARLAGLARWHVVGFSAADRRRLLEAFDRTAEQVSDDELALVGIHGDYSPGNLIVSERGVIVIDFTMAQQGSRFHDVSHLYHHLRSMGENPRYNTDATEQLRGALARGFGDPDLTRRPLFRLFELQHAVCLMAPRAGWSPAARLLEIYMLRRRLRWLRRSCRAGGALAMPVA